MARPSCGKPLYFYDAIASILDAESIDRQTVFSASRWGREALVLGGTAAAISTLGARSSGWT